MLRAELLNKKEISEATEFYAVNAPYGLLYPKDEQWIRDHLGIDFFLVGVWLKGKLIGLRWVAKKPDFIYFSIENDCITLKNDGPYAEIGGECIQESFRGKDLVQLLTATTILFWPAVEKSIPLWSRITGQKDFDGNPLFWNKFGEIVTGLSYKHLLKLPFGTMEGTIHSRWPLWPISLKEVPVDLVEKVFGKPSDALVKYQSRFLVWGYEITNRYVPTSLNRFMRLTYCSVKEPIKFFRESFSNALDKLNTF